MTDGIPRLNGVLETALYVEVRRNWEKGGIRLYFRDPDGHLLEVVTPGTWSIY